MQKKISKAHGKNPNRFANPEGKQTATANPN